jgi:hypothetical protein
MRLVNAVLEDTKARRANFQKAGTLKYVEVKPNLDPSLFPAPATARSSGCLEINLNRAQLRQRRGNNHSGFRTALEVYQEDEDEFWGDSIDDSDLVAAGNSTLPS